MVDFVFNGELIVVVGFDGIVCIYNVVDGQFIYIFLLFDIVVEMMSLVIEIENE